MDSFTHIAIGACIGEAFFEKGFGKKAMLWGALSQSIPDIDFISNLWLNDAEALLAHRGFTHSLLFAVLIVPLFALAADKFHQDRPAALRRWSFFFLIQLLLHLLLDATNNYGIGLFEPFSHQRFTFNLLYVIDPFFSFFPWLACIVLFLLKKDSRQRSFWWRIGVFTFPLYIMLSGYNKVLINHIAASSIQKQGLRPKRYFTTPAPLQNFLWYIVVETDVGYYTSYKSLFEKDKDVNYHYVNNNHHFAKHINDHEEFQHLERFADYYYVLDSTKDGLVFSDLRFGQRKGWMNSEGDFVFRFLLDHPTDNKLVIQRGRLYGWDLQTFLIYLKKVYQY